MFVSRPGDCYLVMNPTDQELLRRYAAARSEEAFAAIVQRHLSLVFAIARRQAGGDAHLAADVAQRVFADLARKAEAVGERDAVSGWLVRATYFAASDVVRKERRRREREREAHMHQFDSSENSLSRPEQLQPAVDAALAGLAEPERDAVMLRFFHGENFANIGARFRISEDAARMRVDRALGRMRTRLERAGIRTTAALLAAAIAEAGTAPVPAALAANVTATATATANHMLLPPWIVPGAVLVAAGAFTIGAVIFGARLESDLRALEHRHAMARVAVAEATRQLAAVRQALRAAEDDRARLREALGASLYSAILNPTVDRLAFVIDTSGSMRDPKTGGLYAIVTQTMEATLRGRGDAKSFAVLDTDGRSIVGADGGAWFDNNGRGRASALEVLRTYRQDSMSSPVKGIAQALALLDGLGDPTTRLEIVVLGDEHVGRRDAVAAQLDRLNPADSRGARQVSISGVAFPTWLVSVESAKPEIRKANTHIAYERLMREVAARHGGTFTEVDSLGAP